MIDKLAFAEGMGMLAGNFGREIDPAILRGYYAILSPVLSTEAFRAVVSRAMASETFWPPAARLIELAGASRGEADDAFDAVRRTLREFGGPQYLPGDVWRSFSPETQRAVTAIGGLWKINGLDADHEGKARRTFREAYSTPTPAVRQIEPPHPDSRIERLVTETAESMRPPTIEEEIRSLFPNCRRCGHEITDGTAVPTQGIPNRVSHAQCEREAAA